MHVELKISADKFMGNYLETATLKQNCQTLSGLSFAKNRGIDTFIINDIKLTLDKLSASNRLNGNKWK